MTAAAFPWVGRFVLAEGIVRGVVGVGVRVREGLEEEALARRQREVLGVHVRQELVENGQAVQVVGGGTDVLVHE